MSPGCQIPRTTRKIPTKVTNCHNNEAKVNTNSNSRPVQPGVKNPLATETDTNAGSGS